MPEKTPLNPALKLVLDIGPLVLFFAVNAKIGIYAATGQDLNGRMGIEWGVYGVPETFLVGQDGRIAYKLVGPITEENLQTTLEAEIQKALAAN